MGPRCSLASSLRYRLVNDYDEPSIEFIRLIDALFDYLDQVHDNNRFVNAARYNGYCRFVNLELTVCPLMSALAFTLIDDLGSIAPHARTAASGKGEIYDGLCARYACDGGIRLTCSRTLWALPCRN